MQLGIASKSLPQGLIVLHLLNGLSQRNGVGGWNGQASVHVGIDIVHTIVQLGANDRFAACHRLKLNNTKSFVGRD